MATEIRETERKYDAPPGAKLPDLSDLPEVAAESGPDEQTLEAEYYDTDDLRLIRNGITLRRRRGGSDAGWHLKLPLGGDSRREIQLPLGRASRQVPGEFAGLVHTVARGEALRPVAHITTVRRRRVLLDDAGNSLAEVDSDDVSAKTMGDAATLSRWQEVEVELTGGGPRLLEAADEQLRRSGLRPASRMAKLQRALADQLPQAADRREPTPLSSAAEVVLAYAAVQVAALTSRDPLVRHDEPELSPSDAGGYPAAAQHAHLVRPGAAPRGLQIARRGAEVAWRPARHRTRRRGPGRAPAGQPGADATGTGHGGRSGSGAGSLRAHRSHARAAVLRALDSDRYMALLDGLDRLLADPPLTPEAGRPAAPLPPVIRRTRDRVGRRMRRARSMPGRA